MARARVPRVGGGWFIFGHKLAADILNPCPSPFLKEPDSELNIAENSNLVKKKIQHLEFFYEFSHYIS